MPDSNVSHQFSEKPELPRPEECPNCHGHCSPRFEGQAHRDMDPQSQEHDKRTDRNCESKVSGNFFFQEGQDPGKDVDKACRKIEIEDPGHHISGGFPGFRSPENDLAALDKRHDTKDERGNSKDLRFHVFPQYLRLKTPANETAAVMAIAPKRTRIGGAPK